MDPVTASLITQAIIASLRAVSELSQRPANDEELDAIIGAVVANSQHLVRINTQRLRDAIETADAAQGQG